MSDETMPDSKAESTYIFIGEGAQARVAAKVTLRFYPVLVDQWIVDQVLSETSELIGALIAEQLNEVKDGE